MRYIALLVTSCILVVHSAWAANPVDVTVDSRLPATGVSGEMQTVGYTFTNNLPFAITNASISGTTPSSGYTVTANNCSTIASGGSCTYEATFTPENTGIYTVALKFNYAGRQLQLPSQTMTATGSSTSTSPSLTLTSSGSSVLSYRRNSEGSATGDATGSFDIQNTGSGTLSNINVTDTDNISGLTIDDSNCTTLTAGNSCTVTVSYAPSNNPGLGNVTNENAALRVSATGSDSQEYQSYYHLSLYNAGAQAALEFPNQITDFRSIPTYGTLDYVAGNGSGELVAIKSTNGTNGELYISTDNGLFWRPVADVNGPITGVKSVAMDSDIIFYTPIDVANTVYILQNGAVTPITLDPDVDINRLKRIGENVYALTNNGVYEVTPSGAEKIGEFGGDTTDIALLDGTLYAGSPAGVFNVSTGTALGALINVTSIAAFDSSLYAAGVNGVEPADILRWNGNTWSSVFDGTVDLTPTVLMATDDRIYAGFTLATDAIDTVLSTVYSSTIGDQATWAITGNGNSGKAQNLGPVVSLVNSNDEVLAATDLGVFQYNPDANIWINYFAIIPQSNTTANHQITKAGDDILMTTDYGLVQYAAGQSNWRYIGGAFGGLNPDATAKLATANGTSAYYVAKETSAPIGEAVYQYTPAGGWVSINGGNCSTNDISSLVFNNNYLYATRLSCGTVGSIFYYDGNSWGNGDGFNNAQSAVIINSTTGSHTIGLFSGSINSYACVTENNNISCSDENPPGANATIQAGTQGISSGTFFSYTTNGGDNDFGTITTSGTFSRLGTFPGNVPYQYLSGSTTAIYGYSSNSGAIIKTTDGTSFDTLINTVNASTGIVHDASNQLLLMDNGATFFVKSYLDS